MISSSESSALDGMTESPSIVDGMTKGWGERWQEGGWTTAGGRPTAHSDLWEKLLCLCAEHLVEFIWVPASENIPEYWRCDQLARH